MLPVLVGNEKTARYVLLNSMLLVGSSLLPWIYGELGLIYGVGALISGAGLLYENWLMVKTPTRELARKNFFGSMRYLGLLFVAIVLDVSL